MSTHRAVTLQAATAPLEFHDVFTPSPSAGQVLVKVLRAPIPSYAHEMITGKRFPLATPCVPGIPAIGRIEEIGSDTTNRTAGQLVFIDSVVRARDDQDGEQGTQIMLGYRAGFTPGAQKLSYGDWRHGSWAEKMLVPLENTYPMNEDVLLGRLGYSLSQLAWIPILLVTYSGWLAGNLQAGQTVIICFATGNFGPAAIELALAMGAGKVVAVGRNAKSLEKIQQNYRTNRVTAVTLTGNISEDTVTFKKATPRGAGADILLDLSPAAATKVATHHLAPGIGALKNKGRAVLMGGLTGEVPFPYSDIMRRNITLIGKLMYEREVPAKLMKLLESGLVPIGKLSTRDFGLENVTDAVDEAARGATAGQLVVLDATT